MSISQELHSAIHAAIRTPAAANQLLTYLSSVDALSCGTDTLYLHLVTPGTIAASKAAIVDANKDVTGFRDLTVTRTVIGPKVKFNGATTANLIEVPDNLAAALYIKNATGNIQATVCTTTGSESFLFKPGAINALLINTVASGVCYVAVTPGATTVGATLIAAGETNTALNLAGIGTKSITITSATTPFVETATGKTNTGYFLVKGKTSAGVKLTCADAMGYTLTISAAAVATADRTLTLPDPGGSDSVAYIALQQTITNKAFSGNSITGVVVTKIVPFVEDATHTTHTGTVPIPAGATIHNIQVVNTVLWGATSASLDVGDDNDADGYFAAVNCKATDLAVGEVLSTLGGVQTWGGKNGAYLVSATGRMGGVTSGNSGPYYAASNNIIGIMTVGTPAATTGRTFMVVSYSVGAVIAAVAA